MRETDKTIEAMKQALEALEGCTTWHLTREQYDRNVTAIVALRAAIEQAEKQEPVCNKDPSGCWNIRCQLGKVCKNTAPPTAQRQWVGLTDEEMRQAAQAMDAEPLAEGWKELIKFARAIEAKLKEKNGG